MNDRIHTHSAPLIGVDKQDFCNAGPPRVTLIQSGGLANKEFCLDDTGVLCKIAHGSISSGWAWSVPVASAQDMAAVLAQVTQTNNTVICAGHYLNDHGNNPFHIVPEAQLAKALGRQKGAPEIAGVVMVGNQPTAARLKRGTYPSEWILFDADNPPGMPDAWAAMNIQQRMKLWEPLLPGISKCERIEVRSSSSRVRRASDPEGLATHAWMRVSNPQQIALMKAHLGVEMVNQNLSFTFKKHSRNAPGEVVGIDARSVFDLAVFDTGRLTFCAKPTADIPGYVVDAADVKIVNPGGGVLDIDWITLPGKNALDTYREKSHIDLKIQLGADGNLSAVSVGQLTQDTEIEVRGIVRTLKAWSANMQPGDKIRCEAPFRESYSEAAFISLNSNTSRAQVYDSLSGTTYMIGATVEDYFGAPKVITEEEKAEALWQASPVSKIMEGIL